MTGGFTSNEKKAQEIQVRFTLSSSMQNDAKSEIIMSNRIATEKCAKHTSPRVRVENVRRTNLLSEVQSSVG